MKKNYQILLCEMLYENGEYISTPVCEIGSNSSSFPGQAYEIKMKHNLNGTKELSFKIPKYYFDADAHEQVINPLSELLVNKSSVEVTVEDKTYFMTVNERTDEKDGKETFFSYVCTDSFIEELSKNGYGLIFKESTGVGTIHDLAERIVEGTEWKYDKEKTGDVYETKIELKPNSLTQQYEEVVKPVPSHPLEYVPELEEYVYRLDLAKEIETRNIKNLSGQTIGFIYFPGLAKDFITASTTSRAGRTVLMFSDGSYVQYYHYEEDVTLDGEHSGAFQRKEIERLEYIARGKDPVILMRGEIPCKQLKIENYESRDISKGPKKINSVLPLVNGNKYVLNWRVQRMPGDGSDSGDWFNTSTNLALGVERDSPLDCKMLNNWLCNDAALSVDDDGFDISKRVDVNISNTGQYYRVYLNIKDGKTYVDAPYTKGAISREVLSYRPFDFTITGDFGDSGKFTSHKDSNSFTLSSDEKMISVTYSDPAFESKFIFPTVEESSYVSLHPIYCHETSKTIAPQIIKNFLYNASNFTDTVGWKERGIGGYLDIFSESAGTDNEYEKNYYLQLTKDGDSKEISIINETAADAKQTLEAGKPYIFKYKLKNSNEAKIQQVNFYKEHPSLNAEASPVCTLEGPISPVQSGGIENAYVIKSAVSISAPYVEFVINIENLKAKESIYFESFSLYPAIGKNTNEGEMESNAEENNIIVLQTLTHGMNIATYEPPEGKPNIADILVDLEIEEAPKAYTEKLVKYFIRENYDERTGNRIDPAAEDTIKYLDFSEVNQEDNISKKYVSLPLKVINVVSRESLEDISESSIDVDKLYYSEKENKYYQYYKIVLNEGTDQETSGSKWDLAFFGDAIKNKIRTLEEEKSTRFNLIQSLGELFEVWPVFEMTRDSDTNKVKKSFYFKKENLRDNHIGFHEGINLLKISREVQSDEIVTKTYVEDIEQSFAEEGYISIRYAHDNPLGENFFYNFQYYANQKLINTYSDNGLTLLENDLNELYTDVKTKNNQLVDFNEKLIDLKMVASELNNNIKSYSLSIAGCEERISSIKADIEDSKICEEDKKKLKDQLSTYEQRRTNFMTKQSSAQKQYRSTIDQIEELSGAIDSLTTQKKDAIYYFENKYSQFIKEGVWSDSKYVDHDSYYYDALKVANTSSMPKISWTIEVADTAGVEGFEDFKYEVGDKTFIIDNEFFNIEKKTDENFKLYVIISEIEECLDEPSATKITVQNFSTSFEDLFQRISASVQSLSLNEHVYARAKNFTIDGKIDASVLQESLSNYQNTLSNSIDNDWVLDSSGLSIFSKENPKKKIRIVSDGIFVSNSTDKEGLPIWCAGLTADGISAELLTAGRINTSEVNIMSGDQTNFTWSALGITAYQPGVNYIPQTDMFVRLDGYGLYFVNSTNKEGEEKPNFGYVGDTTIPWYKVLESDEKNTPITIAQYIQDNSEVSITRYGFNMNVSHAKGGTLRLGYEDLTTRDTFGLFIKVGDDTVVALRNNGINTFGGWTIEKDAWFYNKEDPGNYSTAKMGISVRDPNWAFWAGYDDDTGKASFRITQDGTGDIGRFSFDEDSFNTQSTIKAVFTSDISNDITLTTRINTKDWGTKNLITAYKNLEENFAFEQEVDTDGRIEKFGISLNGSVWGNDIYTKYSLHVNDFIYLKGVNQKGDYFDTNAYYQIYPMIHNDEYCLGFRYKGNKYVILSIKE